DFVLNFDIISSSSTSSDENRLGLSLGCKVDAVALTNQVLPKQFSSVWSTKTNTLEANTLKMLTTFNTKFYDG
ncbi:hypothetical protein AVEN_28053-1, partial [Araneus ventricosus]